MDRTSAVAAAVLVLVAGCSTGPMAGETTSDRPTVTPAPVPATPTTTGTAVRPAPGIGPAGVIEPTALSTAHEQALADRAYILTANLTVRNVSGDILTKRSFITRASPSHRVRHTLIRARGPNAPFFGDDESTELWQIGQRKVQVIDGPNGTSFRELPPWESIQPSLIAPPGAAVFLLASVIGSNVTTRREGRSVVITGDRLRSEALLATAAGVSEPRNASFRVVVRRNGLTRSYTLGFDATAGNRRVRYSITARYSQVGNPAIGPPPTPANLTG